LPLINKIGTIDIDILEVESLDKNSLPKSEPRP